MEIEVILMYLGGAALTFLIYFVLIRWIFRVNQGIRYQKAQMDLLAKLALKMGVPSEEVQSIINQSQIPD